MGSRYPEDETRGVMKKFWDSHSSQASEVEMMLDTHAEELCQHEAPEILGMLPSLDGKNILELGAGIGRFTGQLAEKAKSVTAVDFIGNFIEENKRRNDGKGNITFQLADVTQLQLESESVDIIFSNWLFMYLSDEEVQVLVKQMLRWLVPEGALFFRESCFHQSGDKKREENPSIYRTPAMYNNLIKSVSEVSYSFEIEFIKPVQTYIKLKKNNCQLCWLMHKRKQGDTSYTATFQEFLDNHQYTRNGILRYEKIFGQHFISTGGKETTEEFIKLLDLQPGQKVLDIGSGIGGSAFYMADKCGVHVTGIDLSVNMVEIALERQEQLGNTNVQFEVGDATTREYPENSFDVVYSRDTILHIKDKKALFESFLRWLKPGGKLFITDYCCSDGEHSDAFKKYVAQRGYHLLSPARYGKALEEAGFVDVKATDTTDRFVEALQRELNRLKEQKEEFSKEFSQKDFSDLINGWEDKVVRCGQGDQRWGLFLARKPAQ